MTANRTRTTVWRVLGIASVTTAAAATVVSIWLDLIAPSPPGVGTGPATWIALTGLVMAVPGVMLLWRLGPHPIALVLTGAGLLWALDGPAGGVVNLALGTGDDGPLARVAFWYWARFGSVLLLPIVLILILFPDGRLPRHRVWRTVAVTAVALGTVMPVTYLLVPAAVLADDDPERAGLLERFDPGLWTPAPPDAAWHILLATTFPAAAVGAVLALAVTISRRGHAGPVRRAQLRWLTWAATVLVVLLIASRFLPPVVSDVVFPLAIGSLSVSILIAVTRHGLYAIDRLLSWTVLYAMLLGSVLLVDLGLYLLVGALVGDRAATVLAVLVVVGVYTPLRDRLFRLVNRWVSGTRGDPYRAVSDLADRLEAAGGPTDQLTELVRSVSAAFASGFVRIELDRPDGTPLAAETGTPSPGAVELPLQHEGRPIGRIFMRPGRRPAISAQDRRLLGDLVRLAAAAIRNAELNRELQVIREGLVSAREEERARLRRELHDGLGPLLGGIRLRLEAARNLAVRDPARSLATLDVAIGESRDVVDEIRTLVHDLRPPALDDLGLARAIAQQAERLSGPALIISTEAETLPALGAAVEVAAYRIASEAMANVVKHAGATAATVRLVTASGCLVLEIRDDGAGIDPGRIAGVGLTSLRSRAAELGGALELLPARPGTLVRATLPLRMEEHGAAA